MQTEEMWNDPQNPYESFMVQASAGSGKTFQLTRRFLFLVAAGSDPSHILTVTFTVKAANEMKMRIISEATKLLTDLTYQSSFDRKMDHFYQHALGLWREQDYSIKKPISAREVAKVLLANTQLLKVSTIDALFKEWLNKFPWEAGVEHEGKIQQINPQFSLLDPMELEELNKSSWSRLFHKKSLKELLDKIWSFQRKVDPENGPMGVESRIYELFRLRSFLWYSESGKDSKSAYFPHKISSKSQEEYIDLDFRSLILSLSAPLEEIALESKRAGQFIAAIKSGDVEKLQELKFFTKDCKIHGGTIRGKKRELLFEQILEVETKISTYLNWKKLIHLNGMGDLFYQLYDHWINEREKIKNSRHLFEFNDLAIACHRLFYGPSGAGVLWLMQKSIKHLLLDEFQDTSLLQWSVFEVLASELLSGIGKDQDSGIIPSVFIVGDDKQSIYAFREADPRVMVLAKELLNKFLKKNVPLSKSYRSTQVCMDFVNKLFLKKDENFPIHMTAQNDAGIDFVPNNGRILVHEVFTEKDDIKAVEAEAEFVVNYIKDALDGKIFHPVYDKELKTYRSLQARDCCILYRNATNTNVFTKYLRQKGIPYRREEQRGFFTRCEIKDIISFFKVILNPSDIVSLFSLLKSPIFAFSDLDFQIFLNLETKEDEEQEKLIYQTLESHYPQIFLQIKNLQNKSSTALPHELLAEAFKQLQILERYAQAFSGGEGLVARKNLVKFLELCTKLEDEGYIAISKFVDRIQLLSEKSELASASFDSDAVTLMTIHKSKGLEFPFVSLVETAGIWYKEDRYWIKRNRSEKGVSFLGTKKLQPIGDINFDFLLHDQKKESEAESRRLLYVALTRASQYIVLTGSELKINKSGAFLPELLELAREHGKKSPEHEEAWLIENFIISKIQENQSAAVLPKKIKQADFVPRKHFPMPSETKIVSPHAFISTENKSAEVKSTYSPKLAAAMGDFIHEGLSYFSINKSWDEKEAWNRLVLKKMGRIEIGSSLFQKCVKEIEINFKSKSWTLILNQALLLKRELPIIDLNGQSLIRGNIDFYIQKDEKTIIIVDFKTSQLNKASEALGDEKFLRDFCYQQGYYQQINTYCQSMKRLKPNHEIIGMVWLTKLVRGVELIWLK